MRVSAKSPWFRSPDSGWNVGWVAPVSTPKPPADVFPKCMETSEQTPRTGLTTAQSGNRRERSQDGHPARPHWAGPVCPVPLEAGASPGLQQGCFLHLEPRAAVQPSPPGSQATSESLTALSALCGRGPSGAGAWARDHPLWGLAGLGFQYWGKHVKNPIKEVCISELWKLLEEAPRLKQ